MRNKRLKNSIVNCTEQFIALSQTSTDIVYGETTIKQDFILTAIANADSIIEEFNNPKAFVIFITLSSTKTSSTVPWLPNQNDKDYQTMGAGVKMSSVCENRV